MLELAKKDKHDNHGDIIREQHRVIILALLTSRWVISTGLFPAQQPPNAVIADPAADEQFPPGLCIVTIPSQGFEMDALLLFGGRSATTAGGDCTVGTKLLLKWR